MNEIRFPSRVDIDSSGWVISQYNDLIAKPDEDKVVTINISGVRFIKPVGLTLLSCIIYDLIQENFRVFLNDPLSPGVKEYLTDMQFYEEFHISDEVSINPRSTSVPLTRVVSLNYSLITNLINWLGKNINFTSNFIDAIRENLLELVTNSLDHSDCGFGHYICAQTYPQKHQMELAIVDFGVGIPDNLKSQFPNLDDAEIIKKSTEEGVSSRQTKGAKGQGLYAMKEFINKNGGKFTIVSHNGKYLLDTNGEDVTINRVMYPGTSVCLEINIDNKQYYLSDELDEKLV